MGYLRAKPKDDILCEHPPPFRTPADAIGYGGLIKIDLDRLHRSLQDSRHSQDYRQDCPRADKTIVSRLIETSRVVQLIKQTSSCVFTRCFASYACGYHESTDYNRVFSGAGQFAPEECEGACLIAAYTEAMGIGGRGESSCKKCCR